VRERERDAHALVAREVTAWRALKGSREERVAAGNVHGCDR
jgi:hypothetical protein